MTRTPATWKQFDVIWRELGGAPEVADCVAFEGRGEWPSAFGVSDLAAASVGAAGAAVAELMGARFGELPKVTVDRRLAALWFAWSIKPLGWSLPSPWDPIAGDYRAADGWIRLHTNAPHHRDAVLAVLGVPGEKQTVARAVERWSADELEQAVVERGGCAAVMRSIDEWARHEQGAHVNGEPLVAANAANAAAPMSGWTPECTRPLRGLRVLDLTRVLAGPAATRFLAAFGADVLRIDPPDWEEPVAIPEVALGKRCARLDLRETQGRTRLRELISQAHVLVHGYRADALDRLGFDADVRRELCPGLVDVSLDAYGWGGPWRDRRGFDSLVQMSAGIADAGMHKLGRDKPTPLPVQALDHATGYLMAAAVVRGLSQRWAMGRGSQARMSLARTAKVLIDGPEGEITGEPPVPDAADYSAEIEMSAFGPLKRLKAPIVIDGAPMRWERPAAALGSAAPEW
jgi:CoA-transferase family III